MQPVPACSFGHGRIRALPLDQLESSHCEVL